ncbi:hypothetical protein PoB_004365700 [Plakobranchus ocellatus]|uniref:Uncharacterized protein n=1 Tax=Plakobranchus ocellatus TaxID=259542 RepID=A0AAV4BCH4_9GAST|nr:hypothetical protein PoB_004365700 [Plakobranchus ocellatus]
MKKYRFADHTSRTLFQRVRPFIFMFVGWNAIAYMAWKFINHRAAEDDPSWESRSSAEKILAITGSNPRNAKTKKISLFGKSSADAD